MDEADIAAVSAVRVRGWQAAYAGIVPQTYLAAMTVEGDTVLRRQMLDQPHRTSRDLVAVDDSGDTVGWVCFGPCRSEVSVAGRMQTQMEVEVEVGVRIGEVYALYVSPELTGQGIGGDLLDEAHRQMKDQGFGTSVLWVLADNRRARRFYERAGYEADGATQDDAYDEVTLTELRFRRVL
ncbi:GNAT family N-acetyltransferase [Streptomyces sp. NPDC020607]|uniref:GNAT family N-acetyltransferase n=1 Tax=Streptomyces sp. NPDC020607 TaxID=3365082 RepID=UPI003799CEA8